MFAYFLLRERAVPQNMNMLASCRAWSRGHVSDQLVSDVCCAFLRSPPVLQPGHIPLGPHQAGPLEFLSLQLIRDVSLSLCLWKHTSLQGPDGNCPFSGSCSFLILLCGNKTQSPCIRLPRLQLVRSYSLACAQRVVMCVQGSVFSWEPCHM